MDTWSSRYEASEFDVTLRPESANSEEFLRAFSSTDDVISTVDPILLDLLKRIKRFQNAFAQVHQAFRDRDNLLTFE